MRSVHAGRRKTHEDIIKRHQEAKALEEKCHVACEEDPEAKGPQTKKSTESPFRFGIDLSALFAVQNTGYMHGCRNLKSERKKIEACREKVADESRPRIFAYDDVSGAPLEVDRVKRARVEEIKYFKNMGVYRKVPKAKCYQLTGRAPIGVRWVDVNKQDDENPLYRSRLVAKQFRTGSDPDLFAATPPLEAMKLIISIAATRNARGRVDKKIMVNDVSRAYFYARSESPTYVEI